MRLLILLGAMLALGGCSAPEWSHDALVKSGFTDVVMGGWAPFRCGRDDSFSTKFTATNPLGLRVSGTVCCGLTKSCTVRF